MLTPQETTKIAFEVMENVKKMQKMGYGSDLRIEFAAAIPDIDRVIYNDPATIVYWKDGDKTVVKRSKDDQFSQTTGLALCVVKKIYGEKEYRQLLKQWLN